MSHGFFLDKPFLTRWRTSTEEPYLYRNSKKSQHFGFLWRFSSLTQPAYTAVVLVGWQTYPHQVRIRTYIITGDHHHSKWYLRYTQKPIPGTWYLVCFTIFTNNIRSYLLCMVPRIINIIVIIITSLEPMQILKHHVCIWFVKIYHSYLWVYYMYNTYH